MPATETSPNFARPCLAAQPVKAVLSFPYMLYVGLSSGPVPGTCRSSCAYVLTVSGCRRREEGALCWQSVFLAGVCVRWQQSRWGSMGPCLRFPHCEALPVVPRFSPSAAWFWGGSLGTVPVWKITNRSYREEALSHLGFPPKCCGECDLQSLSLLV